MHSALSRSTQGPERTGEVTFSAVPASRKLRILHIVLSVGETNTTYNEHCLPMADRRDLSICTYFRPSITVAQTIALFPGDGTLSGFFSALRSALSSREYDVIHAHSPHVALLLLSTPGLWYRGLRPRTVVTVHDSYQNYKLRNRLLFLPVFALVERVVCCSQSSYLSFPRFYRFLAGGRLGFAQNGVDLTRIDRTIAGVEQQARTENPFTVVTIGRLVNVKNQQCAISAMHVAGDQSERLVCIGDGPLRSTLVAECRAAGLEDRVEFTGLVPRDKVFEHLTNAELYISTSRGEGLPVSVLEAMACRCPVILSDIPPHREIADGIDFIPLVDPDNVEGFAREINRFREMQPEERSLIGDKCRRLVEERFSLDAMHAGYEEVYSEIVGRHAPALRGRARR